MDIEVALIILLMGVAAGLITQGIVVLKRRRAPSAPVAAPVSPSPQASGMTCCTNPAWVPELDVGSASGFDLMLGKCGACGTPWMNAWCTASSMGGFEPVKPEEAEAMRTTRDPEQFEQLMRRWVARIA